MESMRDEKAMRLHDLLQEALKPMIEKINKLEEEMKTVNENREKLLQLLADKSE